MPSLETDPGRGNNDRARCESCIDDNSRPAWPPLLFNPLACLECPLAAAPTSRRVRPRDFSWPNSSSWRALNEAVGGNLFRVRPLFADCEHEPSGAACSVAVQNSRNPFFIGDQPAGTQVSGWLNAWSPAPSVYAVAAHSTRDVIAAVDFARTNNLRLVVKGGGHSYQGTSNAADSLLIWTRAMNGVVINDAFVAKGCERKQSPQPAVTIDAGAMWIDAYDAVTTKAGRYVQGGGCTTVGVAGLIQSGGFGSFSKGFGTAAAGLLEAEIVTADGVVRTANSCSEPELFWALKGGGGGSWGVVTQVTLRTHNLPEFFGSAKGTIKAYSSEAFRRLIGRFIDFYSDSLFNPHWGEQIMIGGDRTLRIAMNSQGLDTAESSRIWQPFFEMIKADPELTITDELHTGSGQARHWWDAVSRKARGSEAMIYDSREDASEIHAWWSGDQDQVGEFLYGYESAWLPAFLLEREQRSRLADALIASSQLHDVELHFNKGLAGASAETAAAAADTATNPDVLDAFALAIIADSGPPAYPDLRAPPQDRRAGRKIASDIAAAMKELRRTAPSAGSYVSESNYFQTHWQQSYWGRNYPRLRLAKSKYDPEGLFFVHHGVGSEDWSADGFMRLEGH